jgi:hypothetical protein
MCTPNELHEHKVGNGQLYDIQMSQIPELKRRERVQNSEGNRCRLRYIKPINRQKPKQDMQRFKEIHSP